MSLTILMVLDVTEAVGHTLMLLYPLTSRTTLKVTKNTSQTVEGKN